MALPHSSASVGLLQAAPKTDPATSNEHIPANNTLAARCGGGETTVMAVMAAVMAAAAAAAAGVAAVVAAVLVALAVTVTVAVTAALMVVGVCWPRAATPWRIITRS